MKKRMKDTEEDSHLLSKSIRREYYVCTLEIKIFHFIYCFFLKQGMYILNDRLDTSSVFILRELCKYNKLWIELGECN